MVFYLVGSAALSLLITYSCNGPDLLQRMPCFFKVEVIILGIAVGLSLIGIVISFFEFSVGSVFGYVMFVLVVLDGLVHVRMYKESKEEQEEPKVTSAKNEAGKQPPPYSANPPPTNTNTAGPGFFVVF